MMRARPTPDGKGYNRLWDPICWRHYELEEGRDLKMEGIPEDLKEYILVHYGLSVIGFEKDRYGISYLAQAKHIRALCGATTKQIMMSETIPGLTDEQTITFKTLHFKRTSNSAQFPGLNLHQQQGRNLSRKVTTTPHPDVPGTSIAQVGAHQAVKTKKAILDMKMAGKLFWMLQMPVPRSHARRQGVRSSSPDTQSTSSKALIMKEQ